MAEPDALPPRADGPGWTWPHAPGITGTLPPGVHELRADRSDPAGLAAALGDGTWDAVADTWAGAPRVAATGASLLRGRTGRYAYVSSRSVYVWPPRVGGDEDEPVVDADPDAGATDYAADERGGELAAAGLRCRPVEETVADTWAWLQAEGMPVQRPDRPAHGLPAELEQQLLGPG